MKCPESPRSKNSILANFYQHASLHIPQQYRGSTQQDVISMSLSFEATNEVEVKPFCSNFISARGQKDAARQRQVSPLQNLIPLIDKTCSLPPLASPVSSNSKKQMMFRENKCRIQELRDRVAELELIVNAHKMQIESIVQTQKDLKFDAQIMLSRIFATQNKVTQ